MKTVPEQSLDLVAGGRSREQMAEDAAEERAFFQYLNETLRQMPPEPVAPVRDTWPSDAFPGWMEDQYSIDLYM
jgi:hypothetical protein